MTVRREGPGVRYKVPESVKDYSAIHAKRIKDDSRVQILVKRIQGIIPGVSFHLTYPCGRPVYCTRVRMQDVRHPHPESLINATKQADGNRPSG
jgi:hypothetical protein